MVPVLVSRRRTKATAPGSSTQSLELSKFAAYLSIRQFKLFSASALTLSPQTEAIRGCLYISFCTSNLEGLAFKVKIYPNDDYTAVYSPARYKQSEKAVIPMIEVSAALSSFFPSLSLSGSSSSSSNPVQYDCKMHLDLKPWRKVKVSLENDILESTCSLDFIRVYLDGIAFVSQSNITVPFKSGPYIPIQMVCEGEEGQQMGFINSSTSLALELPESLMSHQIDSPISNPTYMADRALDLEYLLRQRRNFPIHAVLIHGPAGCGKSHMVEQVSQRLGFKLIHIAAHDILDMPSSDPFESILKNDAIRPSNEELDTSLRGKMADVILFLDDIDVLLTNDEISDLESQRKVQIHFEALVESIHKISLESSQKIVIICASNNPNAINPSSRNLFEREIVVSLPSPSIRHAFLKSLLEPMLSADSMENMPIEEISSSCHGYSLADLENLVRVATTACQLREKRQKEAMRIEKTSDLKDGGKRGAKVEDEIKMDDTGSDEISQEFNGGVNGVKNVEMLEEDLKKAKSQTMAESMKSDLHLIPSSVKHVDDSQLGGLESQYEQLLQSTVWIYKYSENLERMGVTPPKGILLFGPPGTGKTMLAKCVAKASNANFLSISISDLIRGEIGGTEQEISKIFKIARSISPCIIFLDEIQALFGSRDSSGSHGKNMISQLLLEMDGLNSQQEVIVIGATNRPDWIDPALLRPGRFERCLYIPPPSESARIQIIQANLRKFRIDASSVTTHLIQSLAKRSECFSGADLANLCLKAAWKVIQGDSTHSPLFKPKFGTLPQTIPPSSDTSHLLSHTKLSSSKSDYAANTITSHHLLAAISEFSPTITLDMISLYESFQTKYGRAEQQRMAHGDAFSRPEDIEKAAAKEALLRESHLDARERHRKERLSQLASQKLASKRQIF